MSAREIQPVLRSAYQPPPYLVENVELRFDLRERGTTVSAEYELTANPACPGSPPLVLYGDGCELVSLQLDGRTLTGADYRRDGMELIIAAAPPRCRIAVVTRIDPLDNTALEGLYLSSGNFCTQCEAEGFRRITFYPDRPDVLARFAVTLVADRESYPVLLANGNLVAQGELDGGRHFARWVDPFPKPAYLFALVAGDLVCLSDTFTTRSGRKVDLRLYVEARNRDQCDHALASLKEAMAWDEAVYGLEYDLDIYMIVAVDDFNMGAMENKGLNVFNSKYVLARPDTATDADYQAIREVIGHEYFHNWTGNRVTCRDWFQLSLKEGLTVFRDQHFSADLGAAAVKRIQDVRTLRAGQFPEDAGPTAHPVRPEEYRQINNFYTATVYNKGAEVIRMYYTLLGHDAFVRGVRLYLERHDGQAATIDDFLAAMSETGGLDLTQFGRWYSQAGTPRLMVKRAYDATRRELTLSLRQSTAPTPGQPVKEPFHIPVALGVIGPDGNELPLRLAGEGDAPGGTRVLQLRREDERFILADVPPGSVPSLLRGFSAPVRLVDDLSEAERAFLLAHDRDPFARWEAGQQLFTDLILRLAAGELSEVPALHRDAFRNALCDHQGDPALRALALTLPGVLVLAEERVPADPIELHRARETVRGTLAATLHDDFVALYRRLHDESPYTPDAPSAGRRSLKNLCLAYLACAGSATAVTLCQEQYRRADNMTDSLAALTALVDGRLDGAAAALADFYRRWQSQPLVLDKWFTLQAGASRVTLDEIRQLTAHPDFTLANPNRVRALLGAYAHGNPAAFHQTAGAPYRLLADYVLEIDPRNPQLAARLVGALSRWQRLVEPYAGRMRGELERIAASSSLSRDVGEMVAKSLMAGGAQ